MILIPIDIFSKIPTYTYIMHVLYKQKTKHDIFTSLIIYSYGSYKKNNHESSI